MSDYKSPNRGYFETRTRRLKNTRDSNNTNIVVQGRKLNSHENVEFKVLINVFKQQFIISFIIISIY